MRSERGTATLELALVAPVLMLLVLGVLQFGLWHHAQHVTKTAALEGARVAAAEEGSAGAGRARALELLGVGVGSAVTRSTAGVSVDAEAARARVEARLRAILPIPGLSSFPLEAEARVLRERFRPAGEGP